MISPSHEVLFSPSAATGEIQGETEHGQPRARPLGLGGDSLLGLRSLGSPGAGQVPHHRDIPRVSGHLGPAAAGGAQVHQARVSAQAPVSGVRAPRLGDRDQGGHHVRDLLNLARDKFVKLLEETDK